MTSYHRIRVLAFLLGLSIGLHILVLLAAAQAQEAYVPPTPQLSGDVVHKWMVTQLHTSFDANRTEGSAKMEIVVAGLKADNTCAMGHAGGCTIIVASYMGQTASDYMKFINTGNFAPPNKSMNRKIIDRLIAEGKLPSGGSFGDLPTFTPTLVPPTETPFPTQPVPVTPSITP